MKRLSTSFNFIELTTILFALMTPTTFVTYAAKVLIHILPINGHPYAYAYAAFVACICALSSIVRKLTVASFINSFSKTTTLLSLTTVFIASIIFYLVITNNEQSVPEQVTSPYLSYLFSVFVCMGVGYALADLFISISTKE